MTAWPNPRKPLSRDDQVFGQYDEADLPRMKELAIADREEGHLALPMLVELKNEHGQIRLEVIDGPRCNHTCKACRSDIDDLNQEFGTGAIGVFSDSSGGEIERLRAELRSLAAVIQTTIGGALKAQTELEKPPAADALPEKT